MATLTKLLGALHESVELSSANEISSACVLIVAVEKFCADERDTLRAAFKHGPLFDGDVPSKTGRDALLSAGFIAKVVVKGEDGFNACTNKGAWAYRLLEVMA